MDTQRKQIQLTNSLPGDAISSTQVEGDGGHNSPMQANLIFQGSHDFYFPKSFGVIPNIARAVNSLVQLLSIGWGKKEKNPLLQYER